MEDGMMKEKDKEEGFGVRKGAMELDAWYSLGYAIERMAFPSRILFGTDDMIVGPRPISENNNNDNNNLICSEDDFDNNNDNNNNNDYNNDNDDENENDVNSDANIEEMNHEQVQDGLFLDKSLSYSISNGGSTWTNSVVRSSQCDTKKNHIDLRENLILSVPSHSKNGTYHLSNSTSFTGSNARDLETCQSPIQSLIRVPTVSKSVLDRNSFIGNSHINSSNVGSNVKKSVLREDEREEAFSLSLQYDNPDIDDRRKNNYTASTFMNSDIHDIDFNQCVDIRESPIHQNSKQGGGKKGKSFVSDTSGCVIN